MGEENLRLIPQKIVGRFPSVGAQAACPAACPRSQGVKRYCMPSKPGPSRQRKPSPKAGERTVGVYDQPERKQLPVNLIVMIAIGLVIVAVIIYFLVR